MPRKVNQSLLLTAAICIDAVENKSCSLIIDQPECDLRLQFLQYLINPLLDILQKIRLHEIKDSALLNSIFHMLSHDLADMNQSVHNSDFEVIDK